MFIKSFFAEPAAVVRPRLIVSAAGRVLAALFIAAAGLALSAQSAFAQLQQGASLKYHATLVNRPSLSVEAPLNAAPSGPMIVLKHTLAGSDNKAEIGGFKVKGSDGEYLTGADLTEERNKYTVIRLYTPKQEFISAIKTRLLSGTTGNPTGNSLEVGTATLTSGDRGGDDFIQTKTSRTNGVINDAQYNIVLELYNNHGFVGGDEIEVAVVKPAEGTAAEVEETLFTMVLHNLDFGTDDDIYTVNAKAGMNEEYSLAEPPANSRGVGSLQYKLIPGGAVGSAPDFESDKYGFLPANVWGSDTAHITGSNRNFLRVRGSNAAATARAKSTGRDENVYYYIKDGNDVVIRRPYNFYLIAGLRNDDVDDGIPTFEQRMWCGKDNCTETPTQGRVRVYAREIFGSDATRLELARPSAANRASYFVLRARKRIGPSNSADVTVNVIGAVFAGEMEPRHFRALKSDENGNSGITVTKKSGGSTGDSSVVYTVETNSTGVIDVGDILRIDIPALTGADLSDGSHVTINSTVHSTRASGSRFNFPTGVNGVSKCLSYRIAESRECVLATSHDAVKATITAIVGAPGNYASINASDTTTLISHSEDPRDAILPLHIDAGDYGRNSSGEVNAIAMGAARVVLETETTVDGIDHGVMQANGTLFEIGPAHSVTTTIGSGLILTVSPTPTHGHVVVSKAVDSTTGRRELEQVASGSIRERIYLSESSSKVSDLYEIFYIPSEITPMSGGSTFTLSGEVDLSSDEYQDETATGSRTVTLRLHAVEAKAKAYAIPPPASSDQAFIRVRCEDSTGCDVSLNCSNQTGNAWFGSLEERVGAYATTVVTADTISQTLASDGFVPSRHWGGPTNGRLSCQILARQNQSITTQVLVRSGEILTNNTHVNQGVPN